MTKWIKFLAMNNLNQMVNSPEWQIQIYKLAHCRKIFFLHFYFTFMFSVCSESSLNPQTVNSIDVPTPRHVSSHHRSFASLFISTQLYFSTLETCTENEGLCFCYSCKCFIINYRSHIIRVPVNRTFLDNGSTDYVCSDLNYCTPFSG